MARYFINMLGVYCEQICTTLLLFEASNDTWHQDEIHRCIAQVILFFVRFWRTKFNKINEALFKCWTGDRQTEFSFSNVLINRAGKIPSAMYAKYERECKSVSDQLLEGSSCTN